jgi:hypothetical protein
MKEFEYIFMCVDHSSKRSLCIKIIVFYNDTICDKTWNPSDIRRVEQMLVKTERLERELYDKVTNLVTSKFNLQDYSLATVDRTKKCKCANLNHNGQNSRGLKYLLGGNDNVELKHVYSKTEYKIKYSRGQCCNDGNKSWTSIYNYDKQTKLYVFSFDDKTNTLRPLNQSDIQGYPRNRNPAHNIIFEHIDLVPNDVDTEDIIITVSKNEQNPLVNDRRGRFGEDLRGLLQEDARALIAQDVRRAANGPQGRERRGGDLPDVVSQFMRNFTGGADDYGDEPDFEDDISNDDEEDWGSADVYRKKYLKYKNKYTKELRKH